MFSHISTHTCDTYAAYAQRFTYILLPRHAGCFVRSSESREYVHYKWYFYASLQTLRQQLRRWVLKLRVVVRPHYYQPTSYRQQRQESILWLLTHSSKCYTASQHNNWSCRRRRMNVGKKENQVCVCVCVSVYDDSERQQHAQVCTILYLVIFEWMECKRASNINCTTFEYFES